MGVGGKGTNNAPQVNDKLITIETNKNELEDAIKDFTKKVKYVVATLCDEMSDLAASVKVLILAIRNNMLEGSASKWKEKVKIPKPRPYVGEQDTKGLKNFMFDMDQYFQTIGITLEEAQLN